MTYCHACGSPVIVHGTVFVDDVTYEPVSFDGRQLELLGQGLSLLAQSLCENGRSMLEVQALRTHVLELAFMEVSRDA